MCLGFCPPPPPPAHQNHHRGHTSSCLKKKKSVHHQSPPWHNMVCKTKVTLRHQTLQHQYHLHVCATENWSSKHFCTPLSLSLNCSCWWFDVFSQSFQGFLYLKQTMIQMIPSALGKKKHTQLYASLCCMDAFRSKNESGVGKVIQQSWFIQTEMERYIV